jgi:hypothetical protein
MSLTEVLPARTVGTGDYGWMADERHPAPRPARNGYVKTEPRLYRAEDAMQASMDRAVTVRSAARAERHKARTQTAIKRALFALVGLALAIAAGVGTLSFLVSESSHVPAVVRLVPERAACAMVFVRKC